MKPSPWEEALAEGTCVQIVSLKLSVEILVYRTGFDGLSEKNALFFAATALGAYFVY